MSSGDGTIQGTGELMHLPVVDTSLLIKVLEYTCGFL